MKTKILNASFLLLIIVFSAYSCQKENDDHLSEADQVAFDGMEDAYKSAELYNDSLINTNDSTMMDYYDNMFHFYEGLWEQHHSGYSHDNSHDDHHHDSDGMHNDGMMNDHDNNDGHHSYHHESMDDLTEMHNQYHPEDKKLNSR